MDQAFCAMPCAVAPAIPGIQLVCNGSYHVMVPASRPGLLSGSFRRATFGIHQGLESGDYVEQFLVDGRLAQTV